MYCDRSDLPGSTLYITREACYGCLKAIYAAGVSKVVTPTELGDVKTHYTQTGSWMIDITEPR